MPIVLLDGVINDTEAGGPNGGNHSKKSGITLGFYVQVVDLAAAAAHRRKGIATGVIFELKKIAASQGAYIIFVQADLCDAPAGTLYTKLGVREDVLHFEISTELCSLLLEDCISPFGRLVHRRRV